MFKTAGKMLYDKQRTILTDTHESSEKYCEEDGKMSTKHVNCYCTDAVVINHVVTVNYGDDVVYYHDGAVLNSSIRKTKYEWIIVKNM